MLGAMPELPEVEYGRQIARKVAQGRRIVEARCADDPIVFEGVAPARFRRALVGRRVRAVRRHGKHLWFELDRRPWPCLHFGMTGGFHTAPGGPRVKLKSSRKRPDHAWPPRFTKLHLVFDDGGELVRHRGAPLKALLLDQGFAAGVGNWIADEVLYQARLDPRRRASSLSDAEI